MGDLASSCARISAKRIYRRGGIGRDRGLFALAGCNKNFSTTYGGYGIVWRFRGAAFFDAVFPGGIDVCGKIDSLVVRQRSRIVQTCSAVTPGILCEM